MKKRLSFLFYFFRERRGFIMRVNKERYEWRINSLTAQLGLSVTPL